MNIQEIGQYIITALLGGGGLMAIQQLLFKKKDENIKDYKEFLIELEKMHEKLLEAKAVIMKLSSENEQQKQLIKNLNRQINELETLLKKYEKKYD